MAKQTINNLETGAVVRGKINSNFTELYDHDARTISPEDFTGTDAAKIQAALDTGRTVICTAGSYAVTSTLTFKATGQVLDLNGAQITATGNFDLFEAAAGIQGVIVGNGRIEAAAMTGGYIFDMRNTDRLTIRDLRVFNPFNFAYIQQANVVEINNVWVNNIRGDYGIRWYGTTSLRSDILRLIGVNLSFPGTGTGTGIDWDGNCHTLQAWGVTIVAPNKGVVIRNSAAGTAPEFGFFTNIEIDFPDSYGVEILAGESYYFGSQFYCHGSDTASGVYIASTIAPDRIAFYGGKISGNATYGIENNVRVMVSNLVMDNNTSGNFLEADDTYLTAPRMELDGQFFLNRDSSGNPQINFDSTDYLGYSRSANDMSVILGGSSRIVVSALNDAVQIMVNNALKRVTQGAADSGGTGFRVLRVPN
jgi:hypothetical protein